MFKSKSLKTFVIAGLVQFSCALELLAQSGANGDVPGIRVEIEKEKHALHSPIGVKIRASQFPAGSSIAIFLSPLMPKGNAFPDGVWSPGCAGPLTASSINAVGKNVLEYRWDGRTTWHAPTDLPRRCTKVLAGKYQIIVHIYGEQDVPLVGRFRPPEPLARSDSETFEIVGMLDVTRVEQDLNNHIVSHVWETLELPNSSSLLHEVLVEKGELIEVGNGVYCMNKKIAFLYQGQIRACTSVPVVTPLGLRIPSGNYIKVRPYKTVSENVEHIWKNLFSARTAVVAPLLDELGLSFANEDQDRDHCQSQVGQIWCRGQVVYEQGKVTLLISVRDWKYLSDKDVWLYSFLSTGLRDAKLLFKDEAFACVEGTGKVLRIRSAAWGTTLHRKLGEAFRDDLFECG